jgi:hypothetical protein
MMTVVIPLENRNNSDCIQETSEAAREVSESTLHNYLAGLVRAESIRLPIAVCTEVIFDDPGSRRRT